MTLPRWFSRSNSKICEELRNSKLRPFWIGVIIALLPFPLLLLTLADSTTGSMIHRGWMSFWSFFVFRNPLTPAVILALNFFYDLFVLILLVLLPTTVTFVYSKCPSSAKTVAERFALIAVPILLLWHMFMSLLLFPRTPRDLSTNAGSTFWGDIVGLSLAVQYLCWGVTVYMLPASFKKAIGEKKRT